MRLTVPSGRALLSGAAHSPPLRLHRQPSLPPQLPRNRTALNDAHNLAAELAVEDRPPRNKSELVALLNHGELPAR